MISTHQCVQLYASITNTSWCSATPVFYYHEPSSMSWYNFACCCWSFWEEAGPQQVKNQAESPDPFWLLNTTNSCLRLFLILNSVVNPTNPKDEETTFVSRDLRSRNWLEWWPAVSAALAEDDIQINHGQTKSEESFPALLVLSRPFSSPASDQGGQEYKSRLRNICLTIRYILNLDCSLQIFQSFKQHF